ncbi:STM4015 family protein [Streptomyces sp. NPDC007984]|uniref:STM4015 family protein n=1 Tax=Streptomyces sp. NPDC007984 TaxID=3364801 RepID=UPI0036EB2D1E
MYYTERHPHWGGLPTYEFPLLEEELPASLPAADAVAWRISTEGYFDVEMGEWARSFARFAQAVDLSRVRALLVGIWPEACVIETDGPNTEAMDALVAAAGRLPALRSLFVGDMNREDCEISWISHGDVTGLLTAFPQLEEFGVRGAQTLTFPPVSHAALRRLVIQTGGLPGEVVRGVAASDFPALEELDIWLGSAEYGADATVSDLEPVLTGARLPALRRLALRNSEIQDEIAAALASAPVVSRLTGLALSMGTLSDAGALALLAGQPLTHLSELDLHHHYLSEPAAERVRQELTSHGVRVDLSASAADRSEDEDEEYRYVAVAE